MCVLEFRGRKVEYERSVLRLSGGLNRFYFKIKLLSRETDESCQNRKKKNQRSGA